MIVDSLDAEATRVRPDEREKGVPERASGSQPTWAFGPATKLMARVRWDEYNRVPDG
jgi:hypothetical protein